VCTSGEPVECPAADACHKQGICDPDSGECEQEQLAEGTPCDDQESCTRDDRCSSEGLCAGTPIPDCGVSEGTSTSEDVAAQDVVASELPETVTDDAVDEPGTQNDVSGFDSVTGTDTSAPQTDLQGLVDNTGSGGCASNHRMASSSGTGLAIAMLLMIVAVVIRRRRLRRAITED